MKYYWNQNWLPLNCLFVDSNFWGYYWWKSLLNGNCISRRTVYFLATVRGKSALKLMIPIIDSNIMTIKSQLYLNELQLFPWKMPLRKNTEMEQYQNPDQTYVSSVDSTKINLACFKVTNSKSFQDKFCWSTETGMSILVNCKKRLMLMCFQSLHISYNIW